MAKEESLAGKRVILSIDGEHTRTKCHKPASDTSTNTNLRKLSYETPWREPKLFVIQTLDDNGEISPKNLPIYGVRFGKEDVLELLGKYLQNLNIAQAKSIQIVASHTFRELATKSSSITPLNIFTLRSRTQISALYRLPDTKKFRIFSSEHISIASDFTKFVAVVGSSIFFVLTP